MCDGSWTDIIGKCIRKYLLSLVILVIITSTTTFKVPFFRNNCFHWKHLKCSNYTEHLFHLEVVPSWIGNKSYSLWMIKLHGTEFHLKGNGFTPLVLA